MIYRLVFGNGVVVLQSELQFVLILVHLGVHIVLRGIEQSQCLIYLRQILIRHNNIIMNLVLMGYDFLLMN